MILDNFRGQVQNVYKNPDEFNKWQLVGGRQDREATLIAVATKTAPATKIEEGVRSIVDGLFEGADDAFHQSVTKLVKVAFDVFFGNASAGSSKTSRFFIIPHGYTFYRVDVHMYRYEFISQGFRTHYESQTVVYASRGILDISNLHAGELLAYVYDLHGSNTDVMKTWMDNFQQMYRLAEQITAKGKKRKKDGSETVQHELEAVEN